MFHFELAEVLTIECTFIQSVATRVARERDWELGRLVGYKIGHDKHNVSKDTRLMYCTTGVLLNVSL